MMEKRSNNFSLTEIQRADGVRVFRARRGTEDDQQTN